MVNRHRGEIEATLDGSEEDPARAVRFEANRIA